jgi:hypothetical protein
MEQDLWTIVNFWLSFVANLFSLIGFFITIAIWYGVKSIKAFYVARATIPSQVATLNDLRQKITDNLSGKYDNGSKVNISEALAEVSPQIDNLSPKLKSLNKSAYKIQIEPQLQTFKKSRDLFASNTSKDNAREVNLKLLELIQSIELFVQDDSWRPPQ